MADQCSDCPLEPRVVALEKMNERHTTTHDEMFKRLNALEKENAIQDVRHQAVMDKLDSMDKKYDAFIARIDALEAKPIKRLDTAITTVITAIVGAIVGAILMKIGLK